AAESAPRFAGTDRGSAISCERTPAAPARPWSRRHPGATSRPRPEAPRPRPAAQLDGKATTAKESQPAKCNGTWHSLSSEEFNKSARRPPDAHGAVITGGGEALAVGENRYADHHAG